MSGTVSGGGGKNIPGRDDCGEVRGLAFGSVMREGDVGGGE